MTAVLLPAEPAQDSLADLSRSGAREVLRATLRTVPMLRRGLGLTVVLAFVAGAGRIISPLTVQRAIDADLGEHAVRLALVVGSVALVLAFAASVLLNRRIQSTVESALADLRRAGLRRVHDMPATTADRVSSADLVARLTNDADQMTTFVQGGGMQLVTNAAQLVIATAIMLVYSVVLSVPVLVLAVVFVVVVLAVQQLVARRFDSARRELSQMQSVVAESVIGAPVIRATGTDDRAIQKLDVAVDRARDSLVRTLPSLHGNAALGEFAISTMTIAVILGGVWWGSHGHPSTPRISSGELVGMIFLITFFVRPLQGVIQSFAEAQNALTGWRRGIELAVTPSAVVRAGVPLPAGSLSVEFDDVSARYGDGPLVLRNIDVRLEPGEHVAVVGRTGSGKSTFAKLLTRRLEPSSGSIRLAGLPLANLADDSLPGRVVIVPQDPFLFDGTVAENIGLGKPGAGPEEIVRVLEELGLGEWLATLPAGIDTPVGLRGSMLSVGEQQLVALARTALADPDLVVLDEATSGVDPATDVAVQAALAVLTNGRTTVSIAHRMITAASADRVLVFDDGRIVQAGPHDELVEMDGPYSRLYAAWRENTHEEEIA